jgi:hypothetical protein
MFIKNDIQEFSVGCYFFLSSLLSLIARGENRRRGMICVCNHPRSQFGRN